jgi:acyl carrier protein
MNRHDVSSLKSDLKELIVQVANLQDLSPQKIDDEQDLFREGVGLDSIDLLEIVVQIEKKYGLKIQNDANGRAALKNINALASALNSHLSLKN